MASVILSSEFKKDLLELNVLAAPIILTFLLSFGIAIVSQLIVGHVGATELASAALATMYANAVGNSVILGTASACDTLASQAYGANNLPRVGAVASRALAVSLCLCVPIALSWWFSETLLAALHQPPEVVDASTQFLRVLIIGLPGNMAYEVTKKLLINTSLTFPPMFFSACGICCAAITGYTLVFHSPLGFLGAPVATVTSQWLQLVLCLVYLRWHRRIHASLPPRLMRLIAPLSAAGAASSGTPAGAAGEAEGSGSAHATGAAADAPGAGWEAEGESVVLAVAPAAHHSGTGSGSGSAGFSSDAAARHAAMQLSVAAEVEALAAGAGSLHGVASLPLPGEWSHPGEHLPGVLPAPAGAGAASLGGGGGADRAGLVSGAADAGASGSDVEGGTGASLGGAGLGATAAAASGSASASDGKALLHAAGADTSGSGAGGGAAGAGTAAPASARSLPVDDMLDAVVSGISVQAALSGWKEYIVLGIPSAAMLFVEWGSYEASSIIAGLISTTTLAAHSAIATTASLSFMAPLGWGVASSILVGQAMGDKNVRAAKRVYRVALFMAGCYVAVNGIFILAVRHSWGELFTDDEDVVAHVATTVWILAVYTVFDSAQCIASGVLRGVGRPDLAAGANVLSYICVGLGLAYALAIEAEWGLTGIWAAFVLAVFTAFSAMSVLIVRIDWDKAAEKAHKRATDASGAK